MDLVDLFPASRMIMNLEARDAKGTFREIVEHLETIGAVTDDIGKKLEKAVIKRESEGTTGIGKGLAIPHAKGCSFLSSMVAVFARSRSGVNFNAIDGSDVRLIFFVASPVALADKHLHVMRKIATMHRDDKTLKFLKDTATPTNVVEILREIDDNFRG